MLKIVLTIGLYLITHCFVQANEITLNTTGEAPLNTPQLNGFMDLVAKEAFRRLGYSLKTIKLPAERGLKNVNAGIDDGEMSRIKGLDKIYTNLIRVPEKIMDWEFIAFSHNDVTLDRGWSGLSQYSVTFINGWKILESNVPKQAEVTKVKNHHQLFSILDKRRTDIIIYERWGGLLHISKNPKLKSIKLHYPPLAKKEMFIYLHKKHKNLIPKLQQSLVKMKQDGSYTLLMQKILKPLEKINP